MLGKALENNEILETGGSSLNDTYLCSKHYKK